VNLTPRTIGSVMLLAVALTGCTGQTVAPKPTHSPAMSDAPAPSTPSPVISETPVSPARDSGAHAGAQGTATADGTNIYKYTPTTGDNEQGVARRFGVCVDDIRAQTSGKDLVAGQPVRIQKTTSTRPTSTECLTPGTIYY
jgi:LysM repeat protein